MSNTIWKMNQNLPKGYSKINTEEGYLNSGEESKEPKEGNNPNNKNIPTEINMQVNNPFNGKKDNGKTNKRRKRLTIIAIIIIVGFMIYEVVSLFLDEMVYIYKKIEYDKNNMYRIKPIFGSDINEMRQFVGLPIQSHHRNNVKALLDEMMANLESEYQKMRERKQTDVIISMATYPPRYKYVPYTLYSIIQNRVAPEKIVVTVFKDHIPLLTKEIQRFIDLGIIELLPARENLKPHDKFYYVMEKYRNNPIITIDDDHLLPNFLIEDLYASYKKHPNCISARQVKTKVFKSNGELDAYLFWKDSAKKDAPPSFTIYAQGVGGVLYPPAIFNFTADDLDIMKKYITVDDSTLNYFELRQGTKVVFVPSDILGIGFWEAEREGLCMQVNNKHFENAQLNSKNDIAAYELIRPMQAKISNN